MKSLENEIIWPPVKEAKEHVLIGLREFMNARFRSVIQSPITIMRMIHDELRSRR